MLDTESLSYEKQHNFQMLSQPRSPRSVLHSVPVVAACTWLKQIGLPTAKNMDHSWQWGDGKLQQKQPSSSYCSLRGLQAGLSCFHSLLLPVGLRVPAPFGLCNTEAEVTLLERKNSLCSFIKPMLTCVRTNSHRLHGLSARSQLARKWLPYLTKSAPSWKSK